jgi:hypothetical protein
MVYVPERVCVPDHVVCARPEALLASLVEAKLEGVVSGTTTGKPTGAINKARARKTSQHDDVVRSIKKNLLQSLFKGSLPCDGLPWRQEAINPDFKWSC